MKICTTFVTTKARTKDIMIQKGILDRYLKVINYPKFLKEVSEYTKLAKDQYEVSEGRLWYYEDGKAIPNEHAMKLIDRKKNIYYKVEDNIQTGSDSNLKERLFNNSNSISIEAVLKNIASTNLALKPIADRLAFYHSKQLGKKTNVELVDTLPNKAVGNYNAANSKISISVSGNFGNNNADETIIHESVHSLTAHYLLKDDTTNKNLESLFRDAKNAVSKQIGNFKPEGNLYGFRNTHEFVSEFFSNPEFVKVLKSIPDQQSNLFEKILNIILSFFRMNYSSSPILYDRIKSVMDTVLENASNTKKDLFNISLDKEFISTEDTITRKKTLIDSIKDDLYQKKEVIEKKIKLSGDDTKYKSYDEYLNNLLNQLNNAHKASGILNFLESIYAETLGKSKKIQEFKEKGTNIPASEIAYLKTNLEISNVINDLYNELVLNKDSDLFEDKIKVESLLKEIKNNIDKLKTIVYNDDYDATAKALSEINENKNLTEDDLKALLKQGHGDVSWFTKMFDLASDSIDPIVALLVKTIQKHKFLGNKKADVVNDKIIKATEDLIAYQKAQGINTNNHRELYDFVLETDEKDSITGYLVSDESYDYKTKKRTFFKDNPNASPRTIALFLQSIEDLKSPAGSKYFKIMALPNDNSLKVWYTLTIEAKKQAGDNIGTVQLYKIPTLYKSDIDTLTEKGVNSESFMEVLKNKFKPSNLDYNYQQPATVSGNPINFLPIYFNTPTKELEMDKLSLNLATSIMAFNKMAFNYGEMNSILNTVESTKDLLSKRKVVVTQSGKSLVNSYVKKIRKKFGGDQTEQLEDPTQVISGNETNSYKQLVDFIDMNFYDKPSERTLFLGKDFTKTIDTLNKYTGIAKLSANIFQAGSQVVTGAIWRKVEAVGGINYDSSNLEKARKIYFSGYGGNTLSLIADSVANNPKNKINLFRKYLNVGNHNSGIPSGIEKILDLKHLAALNTSGEHMVTSVTMLAILDKIKIKDKQGVEHSLYDAFKEENGQLFKAFDFDFSDADAFRVHQKVKKINQRIDGVYNTEDKISAKKTALGRSLMLFRGWVLPSYLNRFQFGYDKDGKVTSKYNYADDSEQLGYYTSSGIFLWNVVKEIYKLKEIMAVKKVWDNLSPIEKANFYKFCTEQAFVVGMVILAQALKMANPDDDEDKSAILSSLTVLANRANTELLQYDNPLKTIDLLNSPAAGIGMIESTFGLLWQTIGFEINSEENEFNWLINDQYDQGSREGNYKIATPIKSWIPLWGQIDRLNNINSEKNI